MATATGYDDATKEGGVVRSRNAAEEGDINMDDDALMRLGKKPVLKRNFGFMSILGFSCTVLITWEGALIVFLLGFQNGGPSGVVYGFILTWIGTLSLFATLSELTSMAPTSGGQYHWVSMLAPPGAQQVVSYVTGWFTIGGWLAFLSSACYLCGTMLQGFIVLVNDSYAPEGWHGTMFMIAVALFCVFINTVVSGLLPKFEAIILFLHILGFFAILIPLVLLGPHAEPADVFNNWVNIGGWQSQGLSFCVGLLGNMFAFFGADGAIHMSEEIQNAQVTVPRSIMLSVIINGTLGFGMMLTILFCLGDLDAALNTPTLYPFMEIFLQAVNNKAGSAIMVALVITLAICATVGILASASRILWAFARDKGLPGHSWLSQLSSRTLLPVPAIIVTTAVPCLLGLIVIGSATAFNAIISVSIAGLFSSYLIAAVLLLWRRLTGGIDTVAPANGITGRDVLVWGPWRIRGVLGVANNIFTVCWLSFALFFSFWPTLVETTAATMNWSALIFVAVGIFSTVYYFAWARRVYKGPIIEIEM